MRRVIEWLRDLDARYGYVKRARVQPGEPAPVRLRKLADASEVVLVNPPEPVRSSYAPVVRADEPVPVREPWHGHLAEPRWEEDTGEIPVVVAPAEEQAETELHHPETEVEPLDVPRGASEPEGEDDEDDDGEHEDDQAFDDQAYDEYEELEEPADVEPAGAPAPTYVTPAPLPNRDAVDRLRGHRPD